MDKIKEDFVSFEVAKLLKEKGFDSEDTGDHGGFYSERCYEPGQGVKTLSGQEVGIVYDDLTNSELEYDEYLRPTLQMAMKWLREVHNLWIDIDPLSCNEWAWSIWLMYDPDFKTGESLRNTSSYEEACEEAIKYTLENLI